MFHRPGELRHANGVGVAQRPAPERRESSAHDHREIHVCRIADNLLFKAARGFVDHQKNHAFLQFLARN